MSRLPPAEPGDEGDSASERTPSPRPDERRAPEDGGRPSGDSQEARARWPRWWKPAAACLVILAALGGVLAYRSYQERRIVELSLARARMLVRADTWLGHHEAATLLGVRAARTDPLEAGSLRAFALAMLALDDRDRAAASEADAALVEPSRASTVPVDAQLAMAALALADSKIGTAVEYVSRSGGGARADVLAARAALTAGNASAASEAVARALAADPALPAALAIQGDLLRRSGHQADARPLYLAALDRSARALSEGLTGSSARPGATAPHARATYGLAKLALSRDIPPEEAMGPLARLAADRAGTPQVERARAALYLSALQARAGDRAGAATTLDGAGLDGALRGWLERASGQLEVERGPYRVPDATPEVLQSASDDDPYVPPPPPPPRADPTPSRSGIYGFKVHPVAKKPSHKKASPKQRPDARRRRAAH